MPDKATIHRICEVCGQTFLTRPSRVRRQWGRFCSKSCATSSRNHIASGRTELAETRLMRATRRVNKQMQTEKECRKCKTIKSLSEFSTNHHNLDNHSYICIECIGRPGTHRGYQLKYLFGITMDDYETILDGQMGVCAICGGMETRKDNKGNICRLAVDHDHDNGSVRGILCNACNTGLGRFRDDPDLLRKATNYLERTGNDNGCAQLRT